MCAIPKYNGVMNMVCLVVKDVRRESGVRRDLNKSSSVTGPCHQYQQSSGYLSMHLLQCSFASQSSSLGSLQVDSQ